MEPLSKKVRQAILDANPQASPQDIEEYERLLSLTFSTNPDVPSDAPERAAIIGREDRLRQLRQKLFPGASNQK